MNVRLIEMARPSKAPAHRPVTCNVFALTAEVREAGLVVLVETDLPLKTRIALNITRPSLQYIWTNLDNKSFPVTQCGDIVGVAVIRPIDDLDRDALNLYRHWKGKWPGQISGLPSDVFVIRATLNALDHRFGTCNRDLSGTEIEVRRNGHWVEKVVQVVAPIPEWLKDKLP